MKKIMIAAVLLISASGFAQIDQKRMDRDLEVAKNILGTLLTENNEMFFISRNMEASYLPEYGVIFTLPEDPMMWAVVAQPRIRMERSGTGFNIHVESEDDRHAKEIHEKEFKEQEKAMKEQEKALQEEFEEQEEAIEALEMADQEDLGKNYREFLKTAIVNFLADYADLIGQIKPEQKIMINQKPSPEFTGMVWSSDMGGGYEQEFPDRTSTGFSAEVTKKDITTYKDGTITREVFETKIRFKETGKSSRSADLDLFGKILRSYFSPDMSETYFMEGQPVYERLENVGVIYNVKTYSSYEEGDLFRMPTLGKTYNLAERNKKVEELYPAFESEIRNFILDYGRTIRSIGENELLILKIKLTKCDGCSIPKTIDVTVKASTLNQYDQQKITKDKALDMIDIKKN